MSEKKYESVVDAECNFIDGTNRRCPYLPAHNFAECGNYGASDCPKKHPENFGAKPLSEENMIEGKRFVVELGYEELAKLQLALIGFETPQSERTRKLISKLHNLNVTSRRKTEKEIKARIERATVNGIEVAGSGQIPQYADLEIEILEWDLNEDGEK